MNLFAELRELLSADRPAIMISVVDTRGSAPRDSGTSMLVTEHETLGTIGGGQLEYSACQEAVSRLSDPSRASQRRKQVLGPDCGQCCGGVVELLYSRWEPVDLGFVSALAQANEGYWVRAVDSYGDWLITDRTQLNRIDAPVVEELRNLKLGFQRSKTELGLTIDLVVHALKSSRTPVALFGGGHVGSACIDVLARLDTPIRLVESRRDVIRRQYPRGVEVLLTPDPEQAVTSLPAGADVFVMTHDHALDLRICAATLARDDFRYCGLIGSQSKARRFKKRLLEFGLPPTAIERLICPIGVADIRDKSPAAIAIGVGADYLVRESAQKTVALSVVDQSVAS